MLTIIRTTRDPGGLAKSLGLALGSIGFLLLSAGCSPVQFASITSKDQNPVGTQSSGNLPLSSPTDTPAVPGSSPSTSPGPGSSPGGTPSGTPPGSTPNGSPAASATPPASTPSASSTPQGSPSTSPTPCPLESLTRPIKVIFVVDTSGSNSAYTFDNGTQPCDDEQIREGICAPPTDPQKTFRSGSITAFFNKYESKTNFFWGFETFSGTSYSPYITQDGVTPSFGSASAMHGAITQFDAEVDGDTTPYLAALNGVKDAISQDPDLSSTAPNAPLYFVVFMSDGYPTDAYSNGAVDLDSIDSTIQNIVALSPNRIELSTAYYGTIDDPRAAGTLQNMATTGRGQFINVDTGSTSSMTIDDLITVPSSQCH